MARWGWLAAAVLIAAAWCMPSRAAEGGGDAGRWAVADFGARGDEATDDTAAFQAALDAAGQAGGGIVLVPAGDYAIRGHLSVPANVALEGVWRAPPRTVQGGSMLLAFEGKGEAEGEPFIFLHANSTLRGLGVRYPEQERNPPQPYPWTIRGSGDNCAIVDVLLVNPYQAVDFGTHPCGRHTIRGLHAMPLHRGIFVDKCFDVGRIEDVHLWPFWGYTDDLKAFLRENAEAFIFGRTDWEYVSNCFCLGYKVGFHFIQKDDGPGNVVLTQSGADIGPCAVMVDNVQGHAGVSFSNSQFMCGVVVKETNTGPVKFTGCGFWPVEDTVHAADLAGSGQVTFSACHFSDWDRKGQGEPAIYADCDGLIVSACDFMADKPPITLGPSLKSGVIVGNRLRGCERVRNLSRGHVQIGLNSAPAAEPAGGEGEDHTPIAAARKYFAHLREGDVAAAARLAVFESEGVREQWTGRWSGYAKRLQAGGRKWWGDPVRAQPVSGPPPCEWAIVDVQWRFLDSKGWMMGPALCAYRMRTIEGEWKMALGQSDLDRGIPFHPAGES